MLKHGNASSSFEERKEKRKEVERELFLRKRLDHANFLRAGVFIIQSGTCGDKLSLFHPVESRMQQLIHRQH